MSNEPTRKEIMDAMSEPNIPTPRTDAASLLGEQLGGGTRVVLVDFARQLERELAQAQKAMKLLVSLTPGGSEFVNDPQFCYDHVRERLETSHANLLKVAKQRIDARRDSERLRLVFNGLLITTLDTMNRDKIVHEFGELGLSNYEAALELAKGGSHD